ncbi:hypothetical protein [Virgibacillus proomii]|uniref:hypothetical protein n=1 Tax=Virgibacillus proomii TaxID=84407 RepID=UPI001C126C5C|nr:hypothetical protein [Virgibacillus proomii]MBU5266337.1 hypothetical protein [Virgibacillus proomii]
MDEFLTGMVLDILSSLDYFLLTITSLLYTNLTKDSSFAYSTVIFAIRMFGISMIMMPLITAGLNFPMDLL